jgi:uncharacterized protein YciI
MIWCIHCVDRPDSLALRQETRPSHVDYLGQFDIPVAGPLLDESGEPCGSCIFLEAPDRAAAEDFARNDPYAIAGLFETTSVREFMTVRWPGIA